MRDVPFISQVTRRSVARRAAAGCRTGGGACLGASAAGWTSGERGFLAREVDLANPRGTLDPPSLADAATASQGDRPEAYAPHPLPSSDRTGLIRPPSGRALYATPHRWGRRWGARSPLAWIKASASTRGCPQRSQRESPPTPAWFLTQCTKRGMRRERCGARTNRSDTRAGSNRMAAKGRLELHGL